MPATSTITASLTLGLTDVIAVKVASGHSRSASEDVRAALGPLIEQEIRGQPRRAKQNSADGER